MRILIGAGNEGIARPLANFRGGTRREMSGEERTQACRRVVGHDAQVDSTEPKILNLDGANDQRPLSSAGSASAHRAISAAPSDLNLVDFDQAREWDRVRRDHALAEFGAQQPRCFIRAKAKLLLELQGRDAAWLRGHHIRRPEPVGERQLGVMHDSSRSDRGLATAVGAFVGPRFGFEPPRLAAAAAGADKAPRPARIYEILSAGRLIAETLLKLAQRARNVGHFRQPTKMRKSKQYIDGSTAPWIKGVKDGPLFSAYTNRSPSFRVSGELLNIS